MTATMIGLRAPEIRTYSPMSLRAEISDTGRYTTIRGTAVPYGERANVGWYVEEWLRGALDKSIAEAARSLPLLMFHNAQTWPIGAASDWESTASGLVGEWSLDESDEAQRAAQLADDGFLTGMSIGFLPIRSEWTYADDWNPDLGPSHMDAVVRHEARLIETSLTPTPAYAGAVVELVRSGDRPRNGSSRTARGSREIEAWRDYLKTAERV